MECPHLEEAVKILAPPTIADTKTNFVCAVCNTEKNPWICTNCGKIHCGRYVNGHGKLHNEENPNHSVCMDCESFAVFCYACDEFVINDTEQGHLDKLRRHVIQLLMRVDTCPKHEHCDENSENNNSQNRTQLTLRPKSRRNSTESQENVPHSKRRNSTETQENDPKRKRLKKEDRISRPRSSGLRNLGNTCFMNAVLQSLSNIQQFCGYIKQLPSLEEKSTKKKHITRKASKTEEDILLIEEVRKTLIALWQGTKGAISPESLFCVIWKVVPRFRGYQQQDAHEFMRYLLDRLHTELLSLLPYPNNNSPFIGPKGKSTIVTAIFGGLLQNEVTCLECRMESKKHDPFLDLSLDIPPQFSTRSSKIKEGDPVCRLEDCLSSFTELEELEASELYMCSNCKKKQRSTKKFWIRRLPNVLCLHIKRFRWQSYFRVKLDTFVEFPLKDLNMNKYVLNNLHETRGSGKGAANEYDLAAAIVHHGSGAGSGHYTAYAQHDGQWFNFNDSTVTMCEEQTVARCKAYILFYIRREFKIPDYFNGTSHR